jgi:hypothetical protein
MWLVCLFRKIKPPDSVLGPYEHLPDTNILLLASIFSPFLRFSGFSNAMVFDDFLKFRDFPWAEIGGRFRVVGNPGRAKISFHADRFSM